MEGEEDVKIVMPPMGRATNDATKVPTKRSKDAIQSKASKKHHSSDHFLK
jgi:hypothetical protein